MYIKSPAAHGSGAAFSLLLQHTIVSTLNSKYRFFRSYPFLTFRDLVLWNARGQFTPWPKTLLSSKVDNARILTYGYDAYTVRKSVAGGNRLIDHAANLLNDLTTDRASYNASNRHLIFVAHSLGGILYKEAILISRDCPETHVNGISNHTEGIIFMGAPHRGAWVAGWKNFPVSVLGLAKSINKSLLTILETEDQILESIQTRFLSMIRKLKIKKKKKRRRV
jgi:hypothetical protein